LILNSGSHVEKLKLALKSAFTKIKEEFDEHRESINQNTNEIQANYEYLCRIDAKIEKLSERIDELTMFISCEPPKKTYDVSELTTREKEVFVAMYASEESTYKDLGRRTGLTENLVICYVSNLCTKGVPVQKKYVNNEVKLCIEPEFREMQARENILSINEALNKSVQV